MLLNCLPKRLFSLELAIDPEPVEMQIPRMYLERYSLRLARLGMSEQGRFIGGNLLGRYGFRLYARAFFGGDRIYPR